VLSGSFLGTLLTSCVDLFVLSPISSISIIYSIRETWYERHATGYHPNLVLVNIL